MTSPRKRLRTRRSVSPALQVVSHCVTSPRKPLRIRRGGGRAFRGRFFGGPIVPFVGAGVVWCGVGTLASPWSCPCACVPPPAGATQASPPRTTQPPPLRVRRGFREGVTQYLPSWSSAFLFAHVCVLHTKQMKQMKQVKQVKQVKQMKLVSTNLPLRGGGGIPLHRKHVKG